MPKGDPAGYLPNVKAARKAGKGKKMRGKKSFSKRAPVQKSLSSGGRY